VSKEIDEHVTALIKLGVHLVTGYNKELGIYVLPALVAREGKGRRLGKARLEYQVSNGLEGDRSCSVDCPTYKKAQSAFAAMREEKMKEPPCFGLLYATWSAECNGGHHALTNKDLRPCIFAKRCQGVTNRKGVELQQLRKKPTQETA